MYESPEAVGIPANEQRPTPVGEESERIENYSQTQEFSQALSTVPTSSNPTNHLRHLPIPFADVYNDNDEVLAAYVEPVRSSGDISPAYSEGSTPPHMRWAECLENVLKDREALDLFTKYLIEDVGSVDLLDFWFAYKGLHDKSREALLSDELQSIIRHTCRKFFGIQHSHVSQYVSEETRKAIVNELKRREADGHILPSIFDDAHREIKHLLVNKHADFVRSDIYLQYIQKVQELGDDSPKIWSNPDSRGSSSGDGTLATGTFLATVQEVDEESVPETLGTAVAGEGGQQPTAAHSMSGSMSNSFSQSASNPGTMKRPTGHLTRHNLLATKSDRRLMATGPTGGTVVPPHPYHTNYVPHLPTSAQDSELQSSEADSNVSWSDTSDMYALHPTKRQQRRQDETIRRNAKMNHDDPEKQPFIPRTNRPSVPNNTAQDKQAMQQFHTAVCQKLLKEKKEREERERFNGALRLLSEADGNPNSNRSREAILNYRSHPTGDEHLSILDDHMARVFEQTPKQSPGRSPGGSNLSRRRSPGRISPSSKSPDRRGRPPGLLPSYNSSPFQPPWCNPLAAASQQQSMRLHESSYLMQSSGSGGSKHGPKSAPIGSVSGGSASLMSDRRGSVPARPKSSTSQPSRKTQQTPKNLSDTSGIDTGSSASSMVCQTLTERPGPANARSWHEATSDQRGSGSRGQQPQSLLVGGTLQPTLTSTKGGSAPGSHKSSGSSHDRSRGQTTAGIVQKGKTSKHEPQQELLVYYELPPMKGNKGPIMFRQSSPITLEQFKNRVVVKGKYRYTFKAWVPELQDYVFEDIEDSGAILPEIDNKVYAVLYWKEQKGVEEPLQTKQKDGQCSG